VARVKSLLVNGAEARFIKERCAGKLWFHQPRAFYLKALGRTYRPDFYVVEDGCFYEIIATRQAYSYQRRDIEAFRIEFPDYRLEVVNLGAWQHGPRKGDRRVADPSGGTGYNALMRRLRRRPRRTPIVERLLAVMADHDIENLTALAQRTGFTYQSIYSRVRGAPNRPEALDDIVAALEDRA